MSGSLVNLKFEPPNLEGLQAEMQAASMEGMFQRMVRAVLALTNSFKRTVGGTGKGRLYRRGKRGRTHQASAPGDPPARDYGSYVNSFDWQVEERPGEVEGRVGSRMWSKRGIHLELGTMRMKPRPHVDRSIEAARPDIESALGMP